jgi:hypothetical protein
MTQPMLRQNAGAEGTKDDEEGDRRRSLNGIRPGMERKRRSS